LGGRLATALAGLALIFFTWPGWLHARPEDPDATHRVAWEAYEDPLLRKTALQLRRLRATGQLRNGFNLSPDQANYCAWHCPEEKGYFDYRFGLFPDEAENYVRLQQTLKGGGRPPPNWPG